MSKAHLTFIKHALATPQGEEYDLYLPKSQNADGVRMVVNAAFGTEKPLLQVLSIYEYAVSPRSRNGRYMVLKRGGGDAVAADVAPFTKVMDVLVDHERKVIGQVVGDSFAHELGQWPESYEVEIVDAEDLGDDVDPIETLAAEAAMA